MDTRDVWERKVYECLLSLGGVATTKELQKALGWDQVLKTCLTNIRRRGLLINGERRFVRNILSDFTSLKEGLRVWYLPEEQAKAEERAKEIALERLGLSFERLFKSHYGGRDQEEAGKLIPLLRKVYAEGGVFTIQELVNMSGCEIDTKSIEKTLRRYRRKNKGLHAYQGLYSFHKGKIEEAKLLADLIRSLFERLSVFEGYRRTC